MERNELVSVGDVEKEDLITWDTRDSSGHGTKIKKDACKRDHRHTCTVGAHFSNSRAQLEMVERGTMMR